MRLSSSSSPPLPAAAEPPFVLELEGWARREGRGGLLLYDCREAACGGGASMVSVRRRGAMPAMTLEGFAAAQRLTNEHLVATNPDTRASSMGPARKTERNGIRIFTAPRDLIDTGRQVNHFVNGLLVGPSFTVSIVSAAASTAQAEANFEAFVPHLVDLLWME